MKFHTIDVCPKDSGINHCRKCDKYEFSWRVLCLILNTNIASYIINILEKEECEEEVKHYTSQLDNSYLDEYDPPNDEEERWEREEMEAYEYEMEDYC